MQALPLSAYFLLLEAAVGGMVGVMLVHLRGDVARGFTLFTGWLLWIVAILALWLRLSFPPRITPLVDTQASFWFDVERTFLITFVVLLALFLICLQLRRPTLAGVFSPLVPLIGLAAMWSAALVSPGTQLGGLGAPLAVLAGATAMGTGIAALSLGHWYLVSPGMSVRPLVVLTLTCLAAIAVQTVLMVVLLVLPGVDIPKLLNDYGLFVGVRVVFGLIVPLIAAYMAWRTARIRSLDSATGLLYIVAALTLAGEIVARTLFFLSGVAT